MHTDVQDLSYEKEVRKYPDASALTIYEYLDDCCFLKNNVSLLNAKKKLIGHLFCWSAFVSQCIPYEEGDAHLYTVIISTFSPVTKRSVDIPLDASHAAYDYYRQHKEKIGGSTRIFCVMSQARNGFTALSPHHLPKDIPVSNLTIGRFLQLFQDPNDTDSAFNIIDDRFVHPQFAFLPRLLFTSVYQVSSYFHTIDSNLFISLRK